MSDQQFESINIDRETARYLKGALFADGSTIQGAILGVKREVIGEDSKHVLYIEGEPRGLPLNSTNRKYLVGKLGEMTGNWAGAVVEIFGVEGSFKGTPCTEARVRLVKQA